MNEYNAIVIARADYEQRNQSLTPVPEYGAHVKADQPGWLSVQAGQALYTVGSELAALGERLKHGQSVAPEDSLTEQE